jgi:uncharacterized protein YheU (UPF0270 family)
MKLQLACFQKHQTQESQEGPLYKMSDIIATAHSKPMLRDASDNGSEEGTLSVKLADVPAYLQKGELFRNLKQNEGINVDEHETIVVPKNCLKETASVEDSHDLLFLLHSLRYWAVEGLPESVFAYLTSQHSTPVEEMRRIAEDYPEVEVMPILRRVPIMYHLVEAAGHGDLPLMTYLYEKRGINWQHTECTAAAAKGQFACLQYAHEHGCDVTESSKYSWVSGPCTAAFRNGHVECMQYAHEHGGRLRASSYYGGLSARDCEHTSASCLHYILDRPEAFREIVVKSLDAIGYAAILLGSISCVGKVRALRWRITDKRDIFRTALLADDTSMVEYVIKEGCVLTGKEANKLLELGRTDSLMLLLDRGQHLTANSLHELNQMQEFSILQQVIERRLCTAIAASTTVTATEPAQIDVLIRAFSQAFEQSTDLCNAAAAAGNLVLLQRAVESGCLYNAKVCTTAACGGHLSCLQYLVARGAVVTAEVARAAVRGDHLGCLRYLHEEAGFALTTALLVVAIDMDSMPFVTYMHQRGCSVHTALGARRAAKAGALQCLVYYHDLAQQQATDVWSVWKTVWQVAATSKSSAVKEYARRHI